MIRKAIAILLILIILGIPFPRIVKADVDTPTLLHSETASNQDPHTTSSFSVTDGQFLAVFVMTQDQTGTGDHLSPSSSFSTGGWTLDAGLELGQGKTRASCSYAEVTASGSGTFTIDFGEQMTSIIVFVVEVGAGWDTSTPINETDNNNGTSSTLDLTFSDFESGSIFIAGVVSKQSAGISPTNATELGELETGSGGGETDAQVEYGTNTTTGWTGLGSQQAGVGLELDDDDAAAGRRRINITVTEIFMRKDDDALSFNSFAVA